MPGIRTFRTFCLKRALPLLLSALVCVAAFAAVPRKAGPRKPTTSKTARTKAARKPAATQTAKRTVPKNMASKRSVASSRRKKVDPPRNPLMDLPPLSPYLVSVANLAELPPPPVPGTCLSCVAPVINTAYSLIGTRYRRGGYSPERGFDCSGFVRWVFEQNQAAALPTSAPQQFKIGVPLYREELLPGDLVFFRHRRRGWHVGMYVGDNLFIHAPNRRRTVSISRLEDRYWKATYIGARRIPLAIPAPVTELVGGE